MSKIKLLSNEVIDQIAAGEVVERPASAVKELVENSIDARARSIGIDVNGGGLQLLRITDDGFGMSENDLSQCTLRHATSKLSHVEDLFRITSLGFRGEALPSIAAVSKFSVKSRERDKPLGYELTVVAGERIALQETGMPQGTTVEVRELFFNTPARLKFMKSETAESQRILQVVERMALSRPDIRFTLNVDGRIVLETPGNNNLIDVAASIYGAKAAASLRPMDGVDSSELGIAGLLGLPDLNRNNRSWQQIFLNGRYIEHRGISFALEEAYRSLMPVRRHPVVVLHLRVNPELVDVNVHPTKVEVRFQEERKVVGFVLSHLRTELERICSNNPSRPVTHITATPFSPPEWQSVPEEATTSRKSQRIELFPAYVSHHTAERVMEEVTVKPAVKGYRLIGQVLNSYILLEKAEGLCIVDQHAAHERILYEQFVSSRESYVEQLAIPLTIDFGSKAHFVARNISAFSKFGFDLEPFGDNTYLLRSLPNCYKGDFSEAVLMDILDDIEKEQKNNAEEKLLISLACHSSIKANTRLSAAEMIELLDMLYACKLPVTCPHGRPIELLYTEKELYRLFHPR